MHVVATSLLPLSKPDDEIMPAIVNRIPSSSLLKPRMCACTSARQSRVLMPVVTTSFFPLSKPDLQGELQSISTQIASSARDPLILTCKCDHQSR